MRPRSSAPWASQHRAIASLAVLLMLGCSSGRHRITGGPQNVRMLVKESQLSKALAPLIEGAPRAQAELESLKTAGYIATAVDISGSLFSLGALATAVLGAINFRDQRWPLIGAALGGVLIGNLLSWWASSLKPDKNDYAKVLQLYNKTFPGHPYIAPTIGHLIVETASTSSAAAPLPPGRATSR